MGSRSKLTEFSSYLTCGDWSELLSVVGQVREKRHRTTARMRFIIVILIILNNSPKGLAIVHDNRKRENRKTVKWLFIISSETILD